MLPGLSKQKILLALMAVAALFIIVIIIAVVLGGQSKPAVVPAPSTLTVWGFEPALVGTALENYHKLHNITVSYIPIDPAKYDATLLNALAAGEGPDVFEIQNRALPRYKKLLVPAAATQFSTIQLQNLFPQAVETDFTADGAIYALPSYLDTLALFYNKDLFDQAGIVSPPKTWTEFQDDVSKLRILSGTRQVTRAGAALGGSEKTVTNAVDLVHLLMLQNGATMTDDRRTTAMFNQGGSGQGGLAAFNFYLSFANSGSQYFTWTDQADQDFDAFAGGTAAMVFGYHDDIAAIKTKSPYVRLGVAAIPQPDGAQSSVSYPRYLGFAVSRQSKSPTWAWDFIINLTTDAGNAKLYETGANRPPALRALISEASNDPEFNIFALQALTARSWYEADNNQIDRIFNNEISSVLSGAVRSDKALQDAQDQVSQLMQQQ